MPQYRKKPVIVDNINVFAWGLEAGVMRYNQYIPRDATTYPEHMRSSNHDGYLSMYDEYLNEKGFEDGQWNPYVITIHGQNTRVAEGDMIMPEPDGIHFYPCKPDIFEKTYEAVV